MLGEVIVNGMDTGVVDKLKSYLAARDYDVTVGARLKGKSGLEHAFDILARRDDGITWRKIAINISNSQDVSEQLGEVFNFSNQAFDSGVKDRVLIVPARVDGKLSEFAGRQRVHVLSRGEIDKWISAPAIPLAKPSRLEDLDDLSGYLARLGFSLEKDARLGGRSGIEHTFSLLGYGTELGLGFGLGIDVFEGKSEVGLAELSFFDDKAYDCGLDAKAVVLFDGALSAEAKKFAQSRWIRVIEIARKVQAPPQPTPEAGAAAPKVKLLRQTVQADALQLIPEALARRYLAIPVSVKGNTVEIAMADPTNILAIEAFAIQTKKRIKPLAADAAEVRDAIDFNYRGFGLIEEQISRISPADTGRGRPAAVADSDAPIVQALNLLIEEGAKARASDIHIEPEEERTRVRYRIDGVLQDMMSIPPEAHPAMISRIKIMADMNIADRLRPQDGQISTAVDGRHIDIRVATIPTVNGEMAVLRLFDKQSVPLELSKLGFLRESRSQFENLLRVPFGMILLSGPTGAGKTTTLYAAISSLDTMGQNVITIEDPVEYHFKDINQIEVNPQAGITFASGLRSILRLDPDVILVGEVRDAETADIAVQAALTGHLLLTSIHANDSVGVLFRLLDLGIEPFLIASSVIGIISQRMVRKICPDCSREVEATVPEQMAYERETGEKRTKFLYGAGCKTCSYTGYLGRTGIFEILSVSDNIRRMMVDNASVVDLRKETIKGGMVSMMKDGMRKVKMGITTPAEVLRSAYTAEQES